MLSWEFKLSWGENCSKNRKIRAKVDSRINGRWRLRLMGSFIMNFLVLDKTLEPYRSKLPVNNIEIPKST